MIITNANGRPFLVRVVQRGERYGLDDCLTHDGADPLVEFYDRTYAHRPAFAPRGQFVARYYASTLATHPRDIGLILHGGVSAWTVDASALETVLDLLSTMIGSTEIQSPR